MLALTALAHDRSLPQSVVLSAIQAALEHAYKKDANGQEVRVDLDPDTGKATRVKYESKDGLKRRLSVMSGSLLDK